MFGFIAMCPQLYVNYKLKSVAHLPWKAFMYKAFNTFIDDVFAFAVTMPTIHRLACLRDDLVFFVYLYQRWIYPIDKKRVNEFGRAYEEDDVEPRRARTARRRRLSETKARRIRRAGAQRRKRRGIERDGDGSSTRNGSTRNRRRSVIRRALDGFHGRRSAPRRLFGLGFISDGRQLRFPAFLHRAHESPQSSSGPASALYWSRTIFVAASARAGAPAPRQPLVHRSPSTGAPSRIAKPPSPTAPNSARLRPAAPPPPPPPPPTPRDRRRALVPPAPAGPTPPPISALDGSSTPKSARTNSRGSRASAMGSSSPVRTSPVAASSRSTILCLSGSAAPGFSSRSLALQTASFHSNASGVDPRA